MKHKSRILPLSLVLGSSLSIGISVYSSWNEQNKISTFKSAEKQETKDFVMPQNYDELVNADVEQIALQPKFDSRNYGIVSPVKDQHQEGICWAYAGSAVAETNVLRQGLSPTSKPPNFSPNYMDYATKKRNESWNIMDINRNDILTNATGAAGEAAFCEQTYSVWGAPSYNNSSTYIAPPYNLVESEFFLDTTDKNVWESGFTEAERKKRIQNVKLGIAKYGALTYDTNVQPYYQDRSAAEYYSNNNKLSGFSGHALTVVGWDDTIDGSKFRPEPASIPGGWLIKDSWGEDSHGNMKGFFWMSYESSFGSCIGYKFTETSTYKNNYHWDAGEPYNISNEDAKKECAAIYPVLKANYNVEETLDAVNVAIVGKEVDLTVEVYNNVKGVDRLKPFNDVDPRNGDPVYSTKQHYRFGGTKTIKLPTPQKLERGQYFSIVAKATNDANNALISFAVDPSYDDLTFANANGTWRNIHKGPLNAVARIRAFTNEKKIENATTNSLKYADVELSGTKGRYGVPKSLPTVTSVKLGDKVLTKDEDYIIINNPDSLDPNPNVGTNDDFIGHGSITVRGIGKYKDEIIKTYDLMTGIVPDASPHGWYTDDLYGHRVVLNLNVKESDQKYSDISVPNKFVWDKPNDPIDIKHPSAITYTGNDAKYYRRTIFNVEYESNPRLILHKGDGVVPPPPPEPEPQPQPPVPNPGPEAPPDPDYDLSKSRIVLEKDEWQYTGDPIEPSVKVYKPSNQLAYAGALIIRYEHNIEVGTATVIVTPKNPATNNYYNSQTTTFRIVDKNNPNPKPPAPTPTPTPPSVSIQSVSISGLRESYNDGDNIHLIAKPVFSDGAIHSPVTYTWKIVSGLTFGSSSEILDTTARTDYDGKYIEVTATYNGHSVTAREIIRVRQNVVPPQPSPSTPIITSLSIRLNQAQFIPGEWIRAEAIISANTTEGLEFVWYIKDNWQEVEIPNQYNKSSTVFDFPTLEEFDKKLLLVKVLYNNKEIKSASTKLSVLPGEKPSKESEPNYLVIGASIVGGILALALILLIVSRRKKWKESQESAW